MKQARVNEPNYDEGHSLHIFVTYGRQIQFVPVLGCICCSNAAKIYDYPMDFEFLGKEIQDIFDKMDSRKLVFEQSYKDHWLVPRGVNSWKKFEENSLNILVDCPGEDFRIFRYYPAKPRGYSTRSEEPNLIISRKSPSEDLGKAVSEQFDIIRGDLE